MYLARFSYDVLPIDREEALGFIRRELGEAKQRGLKARLLIPLTRGQAGAALQFELELTTLDDLDRFRQRGPADADNGDDWMRAFSAILTSPPQVEILRVVES
jgi:hypothetical protein